MSDLIDRQAAIDALEKVANFFPWKVPGKSDTYDRYNEGWNDAIGRAEMEIENLPSAEPVLELDEWCMDCKEYDHEKNCCPRFNRVIKSALKDAEPVRMKGKWVRNIHDKIICNQCGMFGNNEWNFCPNCGADMRATDA